MLVYAHRGFHSTHAENTTAAFEAAWRLGVDGIETDVRLTKDGAAVLFHDRNAPDGRAVASVTRDELARSVGFEVPTLEDTLKRWPEKAWNLEIKVPEALVPTLAIVDRLTRRDRILITSFWHGVVAEAARAGFDSGVLVSHAPDDPSGFPRGLPQHGQIRTVVWNYEFAAPALVAAVKEAGYRNFVYGAATPEENARLASWPVDAVITDRPEDFLGRSPGRA